MLKVLVLFDLLKESERRILSGFSKFANEYGGCVFHQVPLSWKDNIKDCPKIIKRAKELNVDAILGEWPGVDEKAAKDFNKPVIMRIQKKIFNGFPMLTGAYKNIGKIAAEFFINQHYDSFAFIGLKDFVWSEDRFEGFRDTIQKNREGGGKVAKMTIANNNEDESQDEAIKQWIVGLPKPTALFACNDETAHLITDICKRAGVSIPDEIALIGVDNDEFLCDISYPSITSIRLDFEKQGYEAARHLHRIISENLDNYPFRAYLEPLDIIERKSTKKHNLKDPYILKIVEYMDRHYNEDISIENAIADIPLSRRAIEIRFQKEMAPMTMLKYLTHLRVAHMCRLLKDTNLPILDIATQAGFDSSENIFRTFKKVTGETPSAYRRNYR